ncbi:MAG: heliorhodopsin HeR [Spirochaetales bacterium]
MISQSRPDAFFRLRRLNVAAGILHFLEGAFMLVIALTIDTVKSFQPEIYTNFYQWVAATIHVPAHLENVTELFFNLPFVIVIAGFLLLTAFFHFLVSTRRVNPVYNNDLQKGINKFRWIEYSITSSVMIDLIAVLFGVTDFGTLVLLFGINMVMNLLGLIMEKMNQYTEKTNWSAFIVGSIAGIFSWALIFMFAFGNTSLAEIPWFVFAIAGSYFLFFNLFPLNMFLQYKKVGKWKDYIYGEKMYIILSFVSKSALAWLVFAGIMQP